MDELKQLYALNDFALVPLSRMDTGNLNQIFEVKTPTEKYFLKEIPSHSLRPELDQIYFELLKVQPKNFKMILPILSKDNHFIEKFQDKNWSLYPFIEHVPFSSSKLSMSQILESTKEFHALVSPLKIPAHPFKTYENWFERGVGQIEKIEPGHSLVSNLKKFIQGRFKELHFTKGNTHFDLNPFNVWEGKQGEILFSDFDNMQPAALIKDYLDVTASLDLGQDLSVLFNFAKNVCPNLEMQDLKYLMLRPRLGKLFDPLNPMGKKEMILALDQLNLFCCDV